MSEKLLSAENPVFRAYVFYVGVLVLKTMVMSYLTARERFRKGAFTSPEDTVFNPKKAKVKTDDPDVERVRRAHLNDLENIPIFIITALGYIMTNPSYFVAVSLFRIFTAARIVHTIVYTVFVMPQPARFLAFFVGNVVTIYMIIVLFKVFTFA